jgi:signal transduction histidine kinase
MTSLRTRLAAGLTLSLVALLLLQWAIASFVLEHMLENQLATRLTQDSENLLAGTSFDAQDRLVLDPQRVNVVYQRPLSGHYYVIVAGNKRELSRSLWDSTLDITEVRSGETVISRTTGPANQPLLMVVHGYRRQNHNITIAVAEDLSALHAGLQRFQLIHGAVSLGILLVLLLTQYLIVTRQLRPLKRIRASMAKLERGEISRIETEGPAEIEPLIAELNRLLAAMSKRTRRSRDALGNLAHALKTRLAVLTQLTEQAPLTEHPELQAAVAESAEAMRRIVERELKRARLVGAQLPGRRINIAEEITLLIQTLQLMHAAKKPYIDWSVAETAHFIGDQEDLLEMLGNLLDNACKWCKTRVNFDMQSRPGHGSVFVVEDDGPGCAPDELDALARRGFRADESKPGTGLGLAIVRDIVESYEGRLSFCRSTALGGLRVEVWLPHATVPA